MEAVGLLALRNQRMARLRGGAVDYSVRTVPTTEGGGVAFYLANYPHQCLFQPIMIFESTSGVNWLFSESILFCISLS